MPPAQVRGLLPAQQGMVHVRGRGELLHQVLQRGSRPLRGIQKGTRHPQGHGERRHPLPRLPEGGVRLVHRGGGGLDSPSVHGMPHHRFEKLVNPEIVKRAETDDKGAKAYLKDLEDRGIDAVVEYDDPKEIADFTDQGKDMGEPGPMGDAEVAEE